MSTHKSWGSEQTYGVIQQPIYRVSTVLQCWLVSGWELVNGDRRRRTGSGSTLEACSRWCATQIHNLLYFDHHVCRNVCYQSTSSSQTGHYKTFRTGRQCYQDHAVKFASWQHPATRRGVKLLSLAALWIWHGSRIKTWLVAIWSPNINRLNSFVLA